MAETTSNPSPVKRRWKPFRLATLLIAILVGGAICYWYLDRRRPPLPTFCQGEKLALSEPISSPNAPASPSRAEWELPSGLALLQGAVDVSFDRKFAVVWGDRVLGKDAKKSCWVINLQTSRIEDLLTKSKGKVAAILRDPASAAFSPNGEYLLISAQGRETACILNLSTRETITVSGLEHSHIRWIGNRLLVSSGQRECPEIFSISGERQEPPKVRGHIIASDPSGTTLVRDYPPAIVNLEGKVLRDFGRNSCDKELPLLSRSGNWAGMFCCLNGEWGYSVVSTTTGQALHLRRPWGATLALTDNGDSIFAGGEQNTTFDVVMTGGEAVQATTADIVFWPKEDDPWKSTKGVPSGPSFNDLVWNAMPNGKSQIIARKAMALTLLGKELFFVQADGNERVLKAVPLPERETSSPARESRGPRKQ